MNKRIIIMLILAALLTFAVIFTVARANSGNLSHYITLPPNKQTAVALESRTEATAAAGPSATIEPYIQPNPPASCPEPTSDSIGVFRSEVRALINRKPFSGGGNLMNSVMAKSSAGNYYWMWAGAPDDERGEPTPKSKQGLIRVIVILGDPCISSALGTQTPAMTDYLAPKGPLTFTKIVGDTILYSIAGGGSGRFNFVTGKFLP